MSVFPFEFYDKLKGFFIRLITPPRPISIERSGWILLAITIGVGVGAISSGNNLLFIVFGGLLSMVIISGILSDLTLRNLYVKIDLPETVICGEEVFFFVEVFNKKRFFQSFDLNVQILFDNEKDVLEIPAYCSAISPYKKRLCSGKLIFKRRGVHSVKRVKVFSEFPFAFFKKMFFFSLKQMIFAGPGLVPSQVPEFKSAGIGNLETLKSTHQGDDLIGIRKYYPGDNPKLIHWKISAKKNEKMIRELAAFSDDAVVLKANVSPENSKNRVDKILGKLLYFAKFFLSQGIPTGTLIGEEFIPPSISSEQFSKIVKSTANFGLNNNNHRTSRVYPLQTKYNLIEVS